MTMFTDDAQKPGDGSISVYAMIGHPIKQVQSPGLFNRYFARANLDATMTTFDIKPGAADTFFALLRDWQNCPGCIITVPHKQAALQCVDQASDRARRIGAVNVVRRTADGRLIGDMVDGLGYLHALRKHDMSVTGKTILLIGAGGVGSAIAHAVADAGAKKLIVLDTDNERQTHLLTSLKEHYGSLSIAETSAGVQIQDIDLIANATPLGMRDDDPLPYPLDHVGSHTFVTDVVTLPVMTRWLKTAQDKGCMIQTGPEMTKPQMPLFAAHLGLTLDDAILAELI